MQKAIRSLSVILCVTLLFVSVFVPGIFAEEASGKITGDMVRVRKEATTESEEIIKLSYGTTVTINGKEENGQEAILGGGTVWYNITSGDITGYVYGKYVEEIKSALYDPDFEKNLENFPESYRSALRELHNTYPNWKFIADKLEISLEEAIDLEYGGENMAATKKWVELNYGIEWRDSRVNEADPSHIKESRWTYASREAIAFFMDPRNALTVSGEKPSYPNIFTFLQQSYDEETQNEEGLKTVVAGTFLENGYGDDADAYIKDIMQAARESKVSPYIIAATIITEQGVNGTSSLISGTYPEYEGYYNYFNYGATGADVVRGGLEYAKNAGWDSRTASITGGAKLYESGYLSVDQDTYYYMDFNVKYPKKIYHQYAMSLYDQCVKAARMRKTCTSNKDAALTFKIPVYSEISDEASEKPKIEDYVVPEPPPAPPEVITRQRGDYDGDGLITVKELATIRMYLLGVKGLSVEELAYLDVSGDNDVTVKDLAMVRMYLLGLIGIE